MNITSFMLDDDEMNARHVRYMRIQMKSLIIVGNAETLVGLDWAWAAGSVGTVCNRGK